ncbi:MAG: alpha-glycosidase [Oscillospiraceae bacterium]|jgi:cyclomaltodextrinase|nr:alpha-glycosidase [Oscillospiraceae bacterium]
MEYSAICHYAEKRYCFALEKDTFLIRIRVKKGDIKRIVLHCQDKYLPLKIKDTRASVEMTLAATDHVCDYFEAVIQFHMVCLRYYFEIEGTDGGRVFYGNYEFRKEQPSDIEQMFDCPQNLREEEMLVVPEWAKNKVVYQIFPARFATDQPVAKDLWYKTPLRREDLKGNLRGIIDRLDHLQELGVDVLYMTPVFQSDSVHKYNTDDYYKIDPSFGTKEDLKELVEKAHGRGMRVILDAVFNHSSKQFFAFADIAEKEERSAYLDWYFVEGFPLRAKMGEIPNFKTFSYFGGMPKLNLKNPQVEEYFIQVGKYWIRECGIDGWRLDVADEIGHRFWKRFRDAVKEEKPDALIVGEEWHYGGDFLEGDEWDSVMNYHFYNAVMDLVAREEISASQFMDSLGFLRGNLHPSTCQVLWNLIDSHDTERFFYSTGRNRAKHRLAAAVQLLLPGMPMIYYGDEYAMDGDREDCRRGMVWDEEHQDREMFAWYKKLIAIRHAYPCLTEGKVTACHTDDTAGTIALTSVLEQDEVTVLFHCKEGAADLPEYAGRQDLLTEAAFDGKLGPWGTAVLS